MVLACVTLFIKMDFKAQFKGDRLLTYVLCEVFASFNSSFKMSNVVRWTYYS